jgi:hypothetical protein
MPLGGRKIETIELKNDFHGTSIRVRVPQSWADDPNGGAWLNIQQAATTSDKWARTLRRIETTLCGMADCNCGTVR